MVTALAFVFRIYPNLEQIILLAKTFGCCRFVFNTMLDYRKKLYDELKKSINKTECNNYVNKELKKAYAWLKEVDKFALTNTVYDMDNAYQKFFKEKAGFPKFKKKYDGHKSYTTNFTNNNIEVDYEHSKIKLPKLGWVKTKSHRKINGQIKHVTVIQEPSGKYYVSILAEVEVKPLDPVKKNIGMDYGLKTFLTTSDKKKYAGILDILEPLYKKLAKLQRQLAKKVFGSNNYKKQLKKVNLCYEKIKNIRKDYLDKLSRKIINENQVIVTEDLQIKKMLQSTITINGHKINLAKRIQDSGWNMFTNMLEYKAKLYGRTYIKINTYYPSSQLCSNCGYRETFIKDLSIRFWECPMCGEYHDRDINAAKNILKEGLRIYKKQLGQELPDITPVEIVGCEVAEAGNQNEKSITSIL